MPSTRGTTDSTFSPVPVLTMSGSEHHVAMRRHIGNGNHRGRLPGGAGPVSAVSAVNVADSAVNVINVDCVENSAGPHPAC